MAGTPNATASFTPFVAAAAEAKIPKPGQTISDEDLLSHYIENGDRQTWWLRTGLPYVDPYDGGSGYPNARIVVGEGTLKNDWIANNAGVRPAMWVNLGEPDPALMAMPATQTSQPIPQGDVSDCY